MTSLDPDYQFINVEISHNSTNGNMPSPAATQVIRNTAILRRMEDFYIAIGRMTFPALSLPLFCAALVPGSNYASNEMVYSFTLSYNNFKSIQVRAIFVPDNLQAQPDVGIVGSSLQSTNPYYYIYSFWSVCKMFNTALATAHADLIAKTGGFPAGSNPPYFYYDNLNEQIVFSCDNTFGVSGNKINVYFNNETLPLMTGFDILRVDSNNPLGQDNVLVIENNYNNFNAGVYTIRPIYFDPSYYSPVGTLQLNTSILINQETVQPVNGSFITRAYNPGNTHQLNPTSAILTDFIPDFTQISSLNSVYIYNKVDDYRYANIISQGALTSFHISLVWTDKAGREVPLLLFPGTTSTIKIGFFHKDLLLKSN